MKWEAHPHFSQIFGSLGRTVAGMASGINIYSQLLISLFRITDISY